MPGTIKHTYTDPRKKYLHALPGSTLTGARVRNTKGEYLGQIQDVMVDIPTGRIAYAVLAFGGLMNTHNRTHVVDTHTKLFALPWDTLTLDEDEQCFVIAADRATLEATAGFDRNNWPETLNPSYGVGTYHPYTPTAPQYVYV